MISRLHSHPLPDLVFYRTWEVGGRSRQPLYALSLFHVHKCGCSEKVLSTFPCIPRNLHIILIEPSTIRMPAYPCISLYLAILVIPPCIKTCSAGDLMFSLCDRLIVGHHFVDIDFFPSFILYQTHHLVSPYFLHVGILPPVFPTKKMSKLCSLIVMTHFHDV